jgi:hypothetical protein
VRDAIIGWEPEASVTGPIVRTTDPVSGSSSTSRLGGTHAEEPSGNSVQDVVAKSLPDASKARSW